VTEFKQKNPKPAAERRRLNPAVGFGTAFAAGMAVFAFLGHMLDRKTGRESLFTLIGIGLGLLYGAWELWKLIALSNQKAQHSRDENGE
jgi:F0F1-type ATP synthase assembly protein I